MYNSKLLHWENEVKLAFSTLQRWYNSVYSSTQNMQFGFINYFERL